MVCDCCSIRKRAAAAAVDATAAATFQTIVVKLAPSVLEIIQHGFRWTDDIERCRLVYRIVEVHQRNTIVNFLANENSKLNVLRISDDFC